MKAFLRERIELKMRKRKFEGGGTKVVSNVLREEVGLCRLIRRLSYCFKLSKLLQIQKYTWRQFNIFRNYWGFAMAILRTRTKMSVRKNRPNLNQHTLCVTLKHFSNRFGENSSWNSDSELLSCIQTNGYSVEILGTLWVWLTTALMECSTALKLPWRAVSRQFLLHIMFFGIIPICKEKQG